MSFAGRAANSSGCAVKPKDREIGSTGFVAPIQTYSLIGSYVMEMAEHREPCESRGSCTVLGEPGGETPSGHSTTAERPTPSTSLPLCPQLRACYAQIEVFCLGPPADIAIDLGVHGANDTTFQNQNSTAPALTPLD